MKDVIAAMRSTSLRRDDGRVPPVPTRDACAVGAMSRAGRWLALSAALLAAVAGPAAGDDGATTPAERWTARCRVDGAPVAIHFASRSGHWTNDDMAAALERAGRRAPLEVAVELYEPLIADPSSACDRLVAYAPAPGRLLALVAVNRRPGYAELAAWLIDVAASRLVDVRFPLGAIRGPRLAVQGPVDAAAGLRVRIAVPRTDVASDGPDGYADAWIALRVDGDAIRTSGEP